MPSPPHFIKKGLKRMEELKQAFYEVMYKYEKEFGETGVMANLNTWAKNKADLLEMLRRHPAWNEEAKAIVFTFDEGRGIEHDVVDEIAFTMEDLAADQIKDTARREAFTLCLRTAISEYSSTLSEQALETIRNHGGIKCAAGQKTSRIIGKLCREFGVDQHSRYNAVFAQLSDALTPIHMMKTALLSVHPCDFLEMSNKDNTWTSCHNLENGSYQAGALSYMTDDVSMIFFTVDPEVTEHFYRAPRRSRQMFFYKDGMLFQSRLYPNDSSETMDLYRGIVQRAIAICLGLPNRWLLKKKREDVNDCCDSYEGSRQYPDYNYYGNLSLLKAIQTQNIPFVIGRPSLCVCCGTAYTVGKLKCTCEDVVVCKDCGQTVPKRNTRYLEGAYHCNACLHVCSACGAITQGTMYPAFDRRGRMVEICESCYQASLEPCAGCSVRRICQIIGNSLCPKTSVAVAREAGAR